MKINKKYFDKKRKIIEAIQHRRYFGGGAKVSETNDILKTIAHDALVEAFYAVLGLSVKFKDDETSCAKCLISLCANTVSSIKIMSAK